MNPHFIPSDNTVQIFIFIMVKMFFCYGHAMDVLLPWMTFGLLSAVSTHSNNLLIPIF